MVELEETWQFEGDRPIWVPVVIWVPKFQTPVSRSSMPAEEPDVFDLCLKKNQMFLTCARRRPRCFWPMPGEDPDVSDLCQEKTQMFLTYARRRSRCFWPMPGEEPDLPIVVHLFLWTSYLAAARWWDLAGLVALVPSRPAQRETSALSLAVFLLISRPGVFAWLFFSLCWGKSGIYFSFTQSLSSFILSYKILDCPVGFRCWIWKTR